MIFLGNKIFVCQNNNKFYCMFYFIMKLLFYYKSNLIYCFFFCVNVIEIVVSAANVFVDYFLHAYFIDFICSSLI